MLKFGSIRKSTGNTSRLCQRQRKKEEKKVVMWVEMSSSSYLSLPSAECLYGRETIAVLSDRICSLVSINNGSSEQHCRMEGKNVEKYREVVANKVYCKRK